MATLNVISKWASLLLTAPMPPSTREVGTGRELRHLSKADVNLPDLVEEVYHFGQGLSGVVGRVEHRLQRLTQKVNGAGFSSDVEPFVRDAERVANRLKARLADIQNLAKDVSAPQFLEVRELIKEKLDVPEFGRELLGQENGRWARSPEAWEPILDVILRRAEYRIEYSEMEKALARRPK